MADTYQSGVTTTVTCGLPRIALKVIVMWHFFCWAWAIVSSIPIGGASFLMVNFSMCIVGVWALADRQSSDAVGMYFAIMLFSILNDSLCFGLYVTQYDLSANGQAYDTMRFSFAFGIIGLLTKVPSLFFVWNEFKQRGGEFSVPGVTVSASGSFGNPPPNQGPYEPIREETHGAAAAAASSSYQAPIVESHS